MPGRNRRVGCLVVIGGSIILWAIIILAIYGAWELIK